MQILTLDGGGAKGMYSIHLLEQLEQTLQIDITEDFDFIAGTSIGSISGTLLALGNNANKVENTLTELFEIISPTKSSSRRYTSMFKSYQQLVTTGYKFNPKILSEYLQPFIGDITCSDIPKLYICALDITHARPMFFSAKHTPEVSILDAILASSAAPAFIAPKNIKIQDQTTSYVDGGLIANNPSLLLIQNILHDFDMNSRYSSIDILSIATHNQLAGKRLHNPHKRIDPVNNILFMLDYFLILQSMYPDELCSGKNYFKIPVNYLRLPGSVETIPYSHSVPMDRLNFQDREVMKRDAIEVFTCFQEELNTFFNRTFN